MFYIMERVLVYLKDAVNVSIVWVQQLFQSLGLDFFAIVSAFVLISAIFKYILSPYFSGSSDTAKNSKRRKKGE